MTARRPLGEAVHWSSSPSAASAAAAPNRARRSASVSGSWPHHSFAWDAATAASSGSFPNQKFSRSSSLVSTTSSSARNRDCEAQYSALALGGGLELVPLPSLSDVGQHLPEDLPLLIQRLSAAIERGLDHRPDQIIPRVESFE